MVFNVSLSGDIFLTGDPVSTIIFSVPSIFIVLVVWFLLSVICFFFFGEYVDRIVSVTFFGFLGLRNFFNFLLYSNFDVQIHRLFPIVLCFCKCDNLIFGLDICGSGSNLVRYNILTAHFSVLVLRSICQSCSVYSGICSSGTSVLLQSFLLLLM